MQASHMTEHYVHLAADGQFGALLPAVTFWQELAAGQHPQLEQGLLCSAFSFDTPWPSWECHPAGAELVLLLKGAASLIFEQNGVETRQNLNQPGDFVLVPAGVWHTADPMSNVDSPCTLMFFTPGAGTEHKPRRLRNYQE
jgi:mannose-6-phosphate isomerase-like protein (cupin superfamily)